MGPGFYLCVDLGGLCLYGLCDRHLRPAQTAFVLDALEQAVHAHRSVESSGLIDHSDRGAQDLPIRHTERLGEGGIDPSVGSVGDSHY